MNPINNGAKNINSANTEQSSQALIIQGYANSVKEQSNVDFSGQPTLSTYQTDINNGLARAKQHADNYLNTIQPKIISNISDIQNYYNLTNAIPAVLPPGSTEAKWIETLSAVREQSIDYEKSALDIVNLLSKLNTDLTTDVAAFSKVVSQMNTAVNGDNGVLKSITGDLDSIDSKIKGEIAGCVVSGLAILGGAFMIAVGGIADFVTAGTTTPLIVGGIGVMAAGIGGEVAAGIALSNLYDEKASLLQQQAKLKAEVQLALGIQSGYSGLESKAHDAVNAASSMKNAWSSLNSDLDNLISDLSKGIMSAGTARTLFLTAANNEISSVLTDCSTIKSQMAGVQLIKATSGQTISQLITQETQKIAA